MKMKFLLATAFVVALSASAQAETKMTDVALKALGGLNGIALHCSYIGSSAAIRKAAAENLPKSRQYGAAFEEATNEAFLDAARTSKACPDKAEFEKDVASAIGLMKNAFGKK